MDPAGASYDDRLSTLRFGRCLFETGGMLFST